jgi:osmotically-inducible protein OsmY
LATLTLSDEKLKRAVLEELRWDPEVDASDIRVEVGSGVVSLYGTVDSYWKKWAAERAVRRVEGVHAVANEIQVKPREFHTHADIARAVARALEQNPLVPHERVHIIVREGWVTLEGQVDLGIEREEAELTARKVPGVVGVTNQIEVKPVRDDVALDEVRKHIHAAFMRAAEIDAQRVVVNVEGGHVTLSGSVRAWFERIEAERGAWRAPGVVSVTNRILVRPE